MEYSTGTKIRLLITITGLILALSSCDLIAPKQEYNVTIGSEPEQAGTVSQSGSGSYKEGNSLDIKATANEGWRFSRWSGDITGSDNPTSVTVSGEMNIKAIFTRKEYNLNSIVKGQGTIEEVIIENRNKDYPYKTKVELTAYPREGWEFVRWKGDLESFDNPDTVTVDSTTNVTAYFGSTSEIPFNRVESEFSVSSYSSGKVIVARVGLTNKMNTEITLSRLTIKSNDDEIIVDEEISKVLQTGFYQSYKVMLLDYPTFEQFSEYKAYWEFQINESTPYIKIGKATTPGN